MSRVRERERAGFCGNCVTEYTKCRYMDMETPKGKTKFKANKKKYNSAVYFRSPFHTMPFRRATTARRAVRRGGAALSVEQKMKGPGDHGAA